MKWIGQHIYDFIVRFRKDVYFDGDKATFTSENANDPVVIIKNTTNDANASRLRLSKVRTVNGLVADAEDADKIGVVEFVSRDDGTPATQTYSKIVTKVADATSDEESGLMELKVATHDGSLYNGFALQGGDVAQEVDVTIANGAASTTTTAGNLTVTTEATIPSRKFTATSATHFEYQGDVLYFGGGSTTQGDLCYLKENGEWGQADADGAATGDDADRDAMGMLAIALGTDPDVDGMFIKGVITMDYDLGDVGNPVYISTTAGDMSNAVPGSGDFVRIVGYCLSDTDGQMYFNPDNTFVEVA